MEATIGGWTTKTHRESHLPNGKFIYILQTVISLMDPSVETLQKIELISAI
jgi:hypothetical protein